MTQPVASTIAHANPSVQHPHDRQILACLGNRYVVFGSGSSLPDRRQLGPEDVRARLPRVGEPREEDEARIVTSLVVDGFEVQRDENQAFGDVTITDAGGPRALVEIKAGDRDFAGVDLQQAWLELAPAAEAGERREIWAFNFERLSLGIVWSEGRFAPSFERLPALNVWEFSPDGSVFDRRHVIGEIDDWVRRIEAVYADVEAWIRVDGLAASRDRTIPLSEEMMQNFAVPDRDLPIRDVAANGTPLVSMVPVGLWLIGFAGMIDVITRGGTFRLGAVPQTSEPPRWVVIDWKTRARVDWSREAFHSMLGLVSAGE